LTYLDGAVRHFTSAITTAATASQNREKMLRDYLEFRRNAGAGATKAYALVAGRDRGQTMRLARTLANNGVVVWRALEPIKLDARSLPAGSYIVPLPQPAGMLARNLLDPQSPMNADFLKRQEERRKKRLPDQIYDTTAWNLPMLYNVECVAIDRAVNVKTEPVSRDEVDAPVDVGMLPDAVVGYALPWNTTNAKAVVAALREGLRARFLSQPFTIAGRKFDRGAAIFRVSDNGADLKMKLAGVAARHGAEVVKLDSAFVSEGVSLGSNQVVALKSPKVLLAWDAPTSSLSAGWARYTLERRYEQSVTAARVGSLGRVDLYRYDTLVLPSGTYSFSADSLRKIKDWVNAGGTLITIGEASRWAARESVGLLDTQTELRGGAPESETVAGPRGTTRSENPESASRTADFARAIQPAREQPELTPGAILRVQLDEDHWLSSGADGVVQALVESSRVFTPIKLDKGRNVGIYAIKDRILASGLVWDTAMDQLPQKAFLIHQPMGQGHVIAFAEDPNYRAYAEMTQFLFINAVLLGPAY
ncbi:MAG: hypothetical protein ACREAM_16875, partial [Blastocatellia bacterium]